MNEKKIVKLYTEDKLTLRQIATLFVSNHHMIKRILVRNEIEITTRGRTRKPFTAEHRAKISASSKGRPCFWKGKKMPENICRKNMLAKLKRNIDISGFEDFDKLKFLTRTLSRHRKHFTDEQYQAFLRRFYFCQSFDSLYNEWLKRVKNKWYRPTLDHKIPLSRGGDFSLENLTFLTWFENRAKAEMTDREWKTFKELTNSKSKLFCENS